MQDSPLLLDSNFPKDLFQKGAMDVVLRTPFKTDYVGPSNEQLLRAPRKKVPVASYSPIDRFDNDGCTIRIALLPQKRQPLNVSVNLGASSRRRHLDLSSVRRKLFSPDVEHSYTLSCMSLSLASPDEGIEITYSSDSDEDLPHSTEIPLFIPTPKKIPRRRSIPKVKSLKFPTPKKVPSGRPATKSCSSCSTRKTPLWRDADDGTPYCNACGIRYRKYRTRCSDCLYVPRKEEKINGNCIRCGGSLFNC